MPKGQRRSSSRPGFLGHPVADLDRAAGGVTDRVMRRPESTLQRACACGGVASEHQPGHRENARAHERGHAPETGAEASAISAVVHDVIGSPGRPLEPDTRAVMQTSFGHDFGRVRVHTDARAAASAQAVGAIAYTIGRHVVLPGEAPSVAPSRILAHELAHVVQQEGGRASDA
ncbi:MAG: DUF4157 domain-containing protein, partial [Geminicoccaceae bacterium]